jgi:hypothetical protein
MNNFKQRISGFSDCQFCGGEAYEWLVYDSSKGVYVKLSPMLDSRGQIKKNLRYKSSAVDYRGGVCYVEAMVVPTRCFIPSIGCLHKSKDYNP